MFAARSLQIYSKAILAHGKPLATFLILCIAFIGSLFLIEKKATAELVSQPWGANGIAVQSNLNSSSYQFGLESDADGNVLMVTTSDYHEMTAFKYSPEGTELFGGGSGVSILDSRTANGPPDGAPKIVSDGEGGAFLSFWTGTLDDIPAQIYVQRILADGSKAWGSDGLRVSTDPDPMTSENTSTLLADGSGGVYTFWKTSNVDCFLYGQRFDSDGNRLWGNDGVLVAEDTCGTSPRVTSSNDGMVFVAWTNSTNTVVAQKYNADGEAQWAEGGVPTVSGEKAFLISDKAGGLYTSCHMCAKVARIASDGSLPWGSTGIDLHGSMSLVYLSQPDADQRSSSINSDNDGNLWVFGYNVANSTLVLQKILPDGSNAWASGVKEIPFADQIVVDMGSTFSSNNTLSLAFWAANSKYYLHRFDSDGIEIWDEPFELPNGSGLGRLLMVQPNDSRLALLYHAGDSPRIFLGYAFQLDFQVTGVSPELKITDTNGNDISEGATNGVNSGIQTVYIASAGNGNRITDAPIFFGGDISFENLSGDSDSDESKVYITPSLGGLLDPEGTYTLYIPKQSSHNAFMTCPDATDVSEVSESCMGAVLGDDATPGVTVVTIDDQQYWKIEDTTAHAGISFLYEGDESEEEEQNPRSSGTSSSKKSSKPKSCLAWKPVGQPDLFQIDRSGGSATLYFTPTNDNTRKYHVVYGLQEGDQRFGQLSADVSSNTNSGVQVLTINDLNPKQSYWFMVAPVNGCAVGEWSNWLEAKPLRGLKSIFYRWI